MIKFIELKVHNFFPGIEEASGCFATHQWAPVRTYVQVFDFTHQPETILKTCTGIPELELLHTAWYLMGGENIWTLKKIFMLFSFSTLLQTLTPLTLKRKRKTGSRENNHPSEKTIITIIHEGRRGTRTDGRDKNNSRAMYVRTDDNDAKISRAFSTDGVTEIRADKVPQRFDLGYGDRRRRSVAFGYR